MNRSNRTRFGSEYGRRSGQILPVILMVIVVAGLAIVIYIGLENTKKGEQAATGDLNSSIDQKPTTPNDASTKQPIPVETKQKRNETNEQRAEAERQAAVKNRENERIAKEKADAKQKNPQANQAPEKLRLEKEKNETLAANSLRNIKVLINAGKAEAAKSPLMTLINNYPDTQAAAEARQLLKSIP